MNSFAYNPVEDVQCTHPSTGVVTLEEYQGASEFKVIDKWTICTICEQIFPPPRTDEDMY